MSFCKRWTPEELLPKANLMANSLMDHENVSAVALTGSLARFEKQIHDIDLVILHSGKIPDGSCADPPRMVKMYTRNSDLDLGFAVGSHIAKSLSEIREDIPINYIFVNEKVLWDCRYLQSLEAKERFPGFFIAVFCQIPLMMFFSTFWRGGIAQYSKGMPLALLDAKLKSPQTDYRGIYIKHRCGDIGCKPKMSWQDREKIIKARKGHVWHD